MRIRQPASPLLLFVAATLGYAALQRWQPIGPQHAETLDSLTQLGAAIFATVAIGMSARRQGRRHRFGWALISIGAGAWAGGQAVAAYYEIVLHAVAPYPGVPDLGWLLFPVATSAGLWLLSASSRAGALRHVLDSLIITGALFLIAWVTTIDAVLHNAEDSRFSVAVGVAYPVADVVLATMAVLGLSQMAPAQRRSFTLLVGGVLLMTFSDTTLAYMLSAGKGPWPPWASTGWVAAFALMGWAALTGRGRRVRESARARPGPAGTGHSSSELGLWQLMLPYLPWICAAVVLGAEAVRNGMITGVDSLLGLAVATLVVARQFLVVVDNRTLLRQLHHEAHHDPLTALANRALFNQQVQRAVTAHLHTGAPVSIIFLDLDNFKGVNDSLGHCAGDQLLQVVAERLRGCTRSDDTVARLGGDEFAVLIEDHSVPPALLAHRLLEVLRPPVHVDGHELRVIGSIGVAVAAGQDGLTPTELLRRADVAMYAAKDAGKGVARMYSEAMEPLVVASGGRHELPDHAGIGFRLTGVPGVP